MDDDIVGARWKQRGYSICLYGGGAGSGKTYSLLLECLRHKDVPQFYTLFLRRTKAELRHPGGPWDESFNIFGMFPDAVASGSVMKWEFGSKRPSKVQFSGIELEKDLEDYKGSQVPLTDQRL